MKRALLFLNIMFIGMVSLSCYTAAIKADAKIKNSQQVVSDWKTTSATSQTSGNLIVDKDAKQPPIFHQDPLVKLYMFVLLTMEDRNLATDERDEMIAMLSDIKGGLTFDEAANKHDKMLLELAKRRAEWQTKATKYEKEK